MDDRLCPSQNHRAVLQLFRAAHGLTISKAGIADICNASEEDLVRISTSYSIAPMLADGLAGLKDLEIDPDLHIFWQEMRDANRLRNQTMKAQLSEAVAILADENIPVVVLKGGCELVLAPVERLHRRFIGDLDLLVANADLDRAQSVLLKNGYQDAYADDAFYHAPRHHDAPLISPRWPAAVEMHQSIGGVDGERFLPASILMESAEETPVANLKVPSPLNRLVHSVFHGQVQDSGYRNRIIALRSIADLVTLAVDEKQLQEARQVFQAGGLKQVFDGMLAATDILLPDLLPLHKYEMEAETWARTAIRRVGTPRRVAFDSQVRNVTRWISGFASDPELRAKYRAKLMQPGRFSRMAQTLRKLNRH